jgi:RNA polymerase sigma factor (sigma-70 family)
MPRARAAATQRTGAGRHRGEHATVEQAAERRAQEHASADPTTDSFQLFLNQASRYPLLTAAEEIELAKRIERGDLAAKEQLINSNLRLVVTFARRYQGHGLPLGDLVQEAMLGLIRAAEKFDWRRGYKFSTYAVLWIKQAIQRGLDNSGRAVRVPAHVAIRERKVNRVRAELATKLNRDPSDEEIAAVADLPLEEVRAVMDLTRVTTSLDAPVGDDSDTSLGELHAGTSEGPEDEVIDRDRAGAVESALSALPELERRVVELRFGTAEDPPTTLRTTARRLKISENEARDLEDRALMRLAGDRTLAAYHALDRAA